MKHATRLLSLLTILLGGFFILAFLYGDVLYMVQSRSLFMQGPVYWHDCVRNIGGMLAWAGTALTQLFYYPWLGAAALTLVWILLYELLRRVFPLSPQLSWQHLVPVICLLVSVVDLGYWVYYLKQPGYFFRESLGVLLVLVMLWLASLCTRLPGRLRLLASLGVIACTLALYYAVGWYAYLALLLLAIRYVRQREWAMLFVIGLLVLYAWLWSGKPWSAGFPLIVNGVHTAWMQLIPFAVLIGWLVLLAIEAPVTAPADTAAPARSTIITHGVFCLLFLFIAQQRRVADPNFLTEIRIHRAVDEFRWKEVLDEVAAVPQGPTRQMIVARNIALLYSGHLADWAFAYPHVSLQPVVSDSLDLHMAQTCATQAYLYHGMTNDCIHWAIENGVEYGLTVSDLKYLSLAAIIGGEQALAQKYLSMLSLTWFHRDFVRRYYPLTLHPELLSHYPELSLMYSLHEDMVEYIGGDDGLVEWRIYKTLTNQTHAIPEGHEAAVVYALMRKETDLFFLHLEHYRHNVNRLPRAIQEAVCLFHALDADRYPLPSGLQPDAEVTQSYAQFRQYLDQLSLQPQRLSDQAIGAQLRPRFGQTYWWFYYFCTHPVLY